MIKIKLCGLSKESDILAANELLPDYIGFVFWPKSRRYVDPSEAFRLKALLDKRIKAVGVFVDEDMAAVEGLLEKGVIDAAQLHGSEDGEYIEKLRINTGKPVIKAFRMTSDTDIAAVNGCAADLILLDSGAGGGHMLDRRLLMGIERQFFLAGGLSPDNVEEAVEELAPYGVDVSSGIETDGKKDREKMRRFVETVRRFV